MPTSTQPNQVLDGTYDAWNRLVKIVSNGQTLASYQYDGAGRLDAEVTYSANQPSGITYEFHNGQNLIELRSANYSAHRPAQPAIADGDLSTCWSPVGRHTVIERDYLGTGSGPVPRLYYLSDASGNVTAVVGEVSGH